MQNNTEQIQGSPVITQMELFEGDNHHTSDEDIWESTPEDGFQSTEKINVREAQPAESTAKGAQVETEVDESDQHNWKKRYNDIRPEFDRRQSELEKLERENERLRLERLEWQQKIASSQPAEKSPENADKDSDPFDESVYFTPEDKEVEEDFPEIIGYAKKYAERAVEIALRKERERVSQIQSHIEQQKAREFASYHRDYMVKTVGEHYLQIDTDPAFHDFVNNVPAFYSIMTQSTDPRDHSVVMNSFLKTDAGQKYLSHDNSNQQPQNWPQQSHPSDSRKETAMGLATGSSPRIENHARNLNDDELWASIREPEI